MARPVSLWPDLLRSGQTWFRCGQTGSGRFSLRTWLVLGRRHADDAARKDFTYRDLGGKSPVRLGDGGRTQRAGSLRARPGQTGRRQPRGIDAGGIGMPGTGAATAAARAGCACVIADRIAHRPAAGMHLDRMLRTVASDTIGSAMGNVWHVPLPETAASVTQSYSSVTCPAGNGNQARARVARMGWRQPHSLGPIFEVTDKAVARGIAGSGSRRPPPVGPPASCCSRRAAPVRLAGRIGTYDGTARCQAASGQRRRLAIQAVPRPLQARPGHGAR
jgi:hypothetical protein